MKSHRRHQIDEQATDPANWDMAKSMLMDVVEDAGTNLEDLETLEEIEALLEDSNIQKLDLV